ncbi:MAG: antA/AntB antirepressor family protein [Candidatus Phlomobacter fragariae]
MKNLINIETKNINDELIQTVNERDLHAFLEIKSRFNDWIKNRIKEYNFIEKLDFITPTKNLVGGGSTVDYHISLDMAKEISMIERNEKGKEARQYFILYEKRAKTAPHAIIPQTLPEALRLATEMAEKVQYLALVNKEQKTEIDSLKNLFQVGMLPVQFCKQLNGVNINQANLFLQERHFLYDAEKDIYKPHVWRVHAYAQNKYLTKSHHITTTETGQPSVTKSFC